MSNMESATNASQLEVSMEFSSYNYFHQQISSLADDKAMLPEDNMPQSYKKSKVKVPWYYAPAFLLFWLVLFFAVVIPIFFHLPDGLTLADESKHPDDFIAEHAERILFDFDAIGPKVVGSFANENRTLQLLIDEVEKIRSLMHSDLFNLDVDIQVVSGAFTGFNIINMYESLQNFVVRFSAKNSTSQSYLLINSHFDSKPGSPGAGDDGAMVVVMLEILRVLATSRQTLMHPIIFLFNGAEERGLLASHAFITQHKWAKNCKAVINLDSAGSGNKEILFQSGPNHPWLIKYYSKYVKHPFAHTLAEEIFQANLIQSDTDFRIWRDYGNVPGLDFAHTHNGYVYHTKYDRFDIIPRGTLQNTGDNILGLTRAFANAPELENTEAHADGNAVFYDFLGLFFIFYTDTEGMIINCCISVAALIVVGLSLWRMAASSYMSLGKVVRVFSLILVLHVIAIVAGVGLPILMPILFDSGDRTMAYFTHNWLVIGLYICPCIFGFAAPTLLYLSFSRNDKFSQPFKLQMVLHSHCVLLALLCLVTTFMDVRSSYLLMISIFFYVCSLVLNLVTKLHEKGYYWTILLMLSQIMPFLFFTYISHALLGTIIPMTALNGAAQNPDILIAALSMLFTILAMGFVAPLMSIFRKPKLILLSLAVITFIFSMIAISPLGFPYRAKTNVGRVHFMQVRRVFYEYDKSVSRNDSGYFFDLQDRRAHLNIEDVIDISKMTSIAEDCEDYMMCGLPIFNRRWYQSRQHAKWLPLEQPVVLPSIPKLTLLNRTTNANTKRAHFEFELSGPPSLNIFLQPVEGVRVKDWSFLEDPLQNPDNYPAPYHVYITHGKYNAPLKFHFDFETGNNSLVAPLFELGISGHFVSFEHERSGESKKFINSFPDYIFVLEWPSSYERYIF